MHPIAFLDVRFHLIGVIVAVVANPLVAHGQTIRLATGSETGVYKMLGDRVRDRLVNEGVTVQVLTTQGSVENLKKLVDDEADVAFAQQDAASEFLASNPKTHVLVLERIFMECLHILVRSSLHVTSPREFRGMRVWPGSPGSGTRRTALRFLDSIGLSPSLVQLIDRDFPLSGLSRLFRERDIDVAMMVTAAGSPALREGLRTREYRLFPLSPDALRILTEGRMTRGQFILGAVQAGTYPGQDQPMPTVLVPVLVVSKSSIAPSAGGLIAQAFRREWEALEPELGSVDRFGSAPPLKSSGLPIASWYQPHEERHASGPSMPTVWLTLFGILPVAAVLLAWRSLARFARRHYVVLAVLVAVWITALSTTGAYLCEHRFNEHFSTLTESFWSIAVYLLSGLEDRAPYTTGGKAFSIIAMILGPSSVAALTGYVASVIIIRFLDNPIPGDLSKHFVILNWNERARKIIEELRSPMIRKEFRTSAIVVVTAEKVDRKAERDRDH